VFKRGNSKLGTAVHAFSIPAKRTCPQSTPACRRVCYAAAGRYRTDTVRGSLGDNLNRARGADFERRAAAEIVTKGVRLLRVHVAGDLFSRDYARAWVRVMRASPDTTFWLYTRAWRDPGLRPVLRQMARLRNVRLWFSADVDSGLPHRLPARVRVAWLMTGPDEVPPGPADLVFRTRNLKSRIARAVVAGDGSAVPVCPTETGLPGATAVTCATCRTCFAPLPGDVPFEPPGRRRVALSVID
jgi:hypothetical protein